MLDPGVERIGTYNPDDGTVDLGFNRRGEVTGIALDSQGNLNIKTGQGGFVTGMGEMITTRTGGIGFTGLRGDIVQGKNVDVRTSTSACGFDILLLLKNVTLCENKLYRNV